MNKKNLDNHLSVSFVKRKNVFGVITLVLLCVLNLIYIPECDELYFRSWQFETIVDRLLSKPIQEDYIIGIMHNGRILGNFLGVLEGQLLATKLWWFRAPFFALGIMALGWGMTHLSFGKDKKYYLLALLLIICAPREIYQNVYSWGVAYINYLVPVLGFIWLYVLMEKEHVVVGKQMHLFIIAFCSQLFLETMTIAMCLFTGYIIFSKNISSKNKTPACLGIWGGGLVMLLNPEYQYVASNESIHSVGLSWHGLYENLCIISYQAFLKHFLLLMGISWLFLKNNHMQKGKYEWTEMIKFCLTAIAVAVANLCKVFFIHAQIVYPILLLVVGCSWLHSWIRLHKTKEWGKTGVFMFGSVISVVPLLVIQSELSERMYYGTYLMLCMLLLLLLGKTNISFEKWNKGYVGIISVYLIFLIGIYGGNYVVNQWRIQLGKSQIAAGAESVTLPVVPFPDYCTNEHVGKGDLAYVLYREVPFDVSLKFVSYKEYLNSSQYEN